MNKSILYIEWRRFLLYFLVGLPASIFRIPSSDFFRQLRKPIQIAIWIGRSWGGSSVFRLRYSVFFFIFFINSSFINETQNKPYHLFKIERSKDANEIFYDINTEKTGYLNINTPINPYWIRATEGGLLKPLNWIQQNYAYGLDYIYKSENYAKFRFVSYKKRDFVLKKDSKGNFKVFTQLNQKDVEVNRIFIQLDGGTFWFPKISRVELHTKDPLTNKEIIEIITP